MTSTPTPHLPTLPSHRASAVLAALTLAAGIALGALIGPGPAASLASTARAAALGRVLTLLALGAADSHSHSQSPPSPGTAHPPATAPQPAPASASEASAGTGSASHAAGGSPGTSSSSSSSSSPSSSSHGSASPTSSTKPAASGGEGEPAHTEPLPPIANVWLVVLPYGGNLENALRQSTAAPYLGQLATKGTVLSAYSSLAAGQLAGAATLLSGQVGASVNTLAPPPCAAAAPASTPAGQPAAAGQVAASAPCPSGEPAGVQAADAFLQEVVPTIMASPSYTEHGLIVVTFATPAPGLTYPAGTLASTLTAAGPPAGALLLSPFLRHAGTRSPSAFNPTSPRVSLKALLTPTQPTHQ